MSSSSNSAKKAARVIAMEEEHQALMEEDDRCPFYKKYWRKFYRLATHGVNVDVFDVSFISSEFIALANRSVSL